MSEFRHNIHQAITELVEPLIRSFGLHLWGLVVPAARGGALRIYIDSPEGVTVDQCAEVSRHLNLILDVEDPLPGPYTLEVSSPGLERPFFSCEQLNPYLGQRIVLQLKEAIQDSKKWRGTLISADNNTIVLQTHVQEIAVSWSNVKKAHLLYEQ